MGLFKEDTIRQAMVDMYTYNYDQKINNPKLSPLKMAYKKEKQEVQEIFLDGYDAARTFSNDQYEQLRKAVLKCFSWIPRLANEELTEAEIELKKLLNLKLT